ncbi:MAG: hypothetical protein IOD12_13395 [Silvanigrellales bacterium]|jgi:hypothetical protein|nr:hypothetical protein [Silvanigrellales bacterium]
MWKNFFVPLACSISHSAVATPPCSFSKISQYQGSENSEFKMGVVSSDCEVRPGIWASSASSVVWAGENQLLGVYRLGRDSLVENRFRLARNGHVAWHRNGRLSYADSFIADTEIAPAIWARMKLPSEGFSSSVNWREDGSVSWVQVLAKDLINEAGQVIASRCSTAWFSRAGTLLSIGDKFICEVP